MIAWHYTIGLHIQSIFGSGELRPTDSYIEKGEKPIIWFSKNQQWEQTACKAFIDKKGNRTRLTMKETGEAGGGLFRFGIEADKLINWPRLGSVANMRSKIRKGLEMEGLRQGSHFLDWCGSVTPVPLDDLCLEVMDDSGKWIDHTLHPLFCSQV